MIRAARPDGAVGVAGVPLPGKRSALPSNDEVRRMLTTPGGLTETADGVVRGMPVRVWRTIPPTLRAVLEAARGHGDRDALVYEGERVSYTGFYRAAATLAADLVRNGLTKGDRVAIALRNLPEWPVAYFAAAAVGAVVVPLNAWGTADELSYGLADSGSRFALVDGERYDRLAGKLAGLARVYVTRRAGEIGDAVRLETLIGPPDKWADLAEVALPAAQIEPDDVATIYYTSGTTGRPKGCYASHRATLSNIAALPFAGARAALRGGEPVPPPPIGPKASLVGLPLFHVTGCNITMIPNIHAGNKLVIMHKWDPVRAFELIEAERITSSGGVPALAWQLMEHPRRGEFDLSSLERINWGGAPSSPELERGMRGAFPGVSLTTGWGMTELCGIHTDIAGVDFARRPRSCGAPVGDYRLEARDADGVVLPAGAVGELWAFGANTAIGYWNRPEATAETFVDGWVRTGDVGYLDEEGFAFIVDRAKDMLIRGGENIYCIEVEAALHEHPGILDAAVVGLPHRTLGEEPAAVVTRRAGHEVDEPALRAFVAARLAAFKVPVRILFIDEPLPRNPQGKIMKPVCRAMLVA